jgi:hypothetical protein
MLKSENILVRRGDRGDFAIFERAAVERMAALLPAQSKEVVSNVLGISSNTWLKIKRGEPIRASIAFGLAERLVQ